MGLTEAWPWGPWTLCSAQSDPGYSPGLLPPSDCRAEWAELVTGGLTQLDP